MEDKPKKQQSPYDILRDTYEELTEHNKELMILLISTAKKVSALKNEAKEIRKCIEEAIHHSPHASTRWEVFASEITKIDFIELDETMERPKVLVSSTKSVKTPCGNLLVTVGKCNGRIMEIIARKEDIANCPSSFLNGLSRIVNIALKYDVPIEEIIRTLENSERCGNTIFGTGLKIKRALNNCGDIISQILREENKNGT